MTISFVPVDDEQRVGVQLPPWTSAAFVAVAVGVAAGAFVSGASELAAVLIGWAVCLCLPIWSAVVEGRRRAADRLATVLAWSAFGVAVAPLMSILWSVISKGSRVLSTEFFTYSMQGVVGEGGGIYQALIGTLLITGAAAVISIPIGILAAIYVVEYADGNRLSRWASFLIDVMTGMPSIVAGLFAYALFVLLFGDGVRMGIGGSVALSVLMIPALARSTQAKLRLVPNELREAAYALGVPKWRTIVKVVLPTSLAGIVTGIMLSIALVVGETAPLLIIAGTTDSVNFDLAHGEMATLPVFIYTSALGPGIQPAVGVDRAWGAAFVLLMIVIFLNLVARAVSAYFSPRADS